MKCICEPNRCTGCGICIQSCKNKMLNLVIKKNGYNYPICDSQCTECSFVCPQNTNVSSNRPIKSLALQLTDNSELIKATSGGAFTAICKSVFSKNGIVYGADYDSRLKVIHKCAFSFPEIEGMHGSKYIYSDFSSNISEVKKHLDLGRYVFVTGLPCQIAGLYRYLGKQYDNLLTADLICNGVPSYKVWRAYLDYIEKKHKIKVIDYKFRDKRKYGVSHTVVIDYVKNGKNYTKTIKNRNEISYYEAFGKLICINDSCFNCKYTSLDRISDFTLGGFWAIDEVETKLDSYKGVSLVLVNSKKAENMIPILKEYSTIEQFPVNVSINHNSALLKSAGEKNNSMIFEDLDNMGYKYTANKYFPTKSKFHNFLINRALVKKALALYKKR